MLIYETVLRNNLNVSMNVAVTDNIVNKTLGNVASFEVIFLFDMLTIIKAIATANASTIKFVNQFFIILEFYAVDSDSLLQKTS